MLSLFCWRPGATWKLEDGFGNTAGWHDDRFLAVDSMQPRDIILHGPVVVNSPLPSILLLHYS